MSNVGSNFLSGLSTCAFIGSNGNDIRKGTMKKVDDIQEQANKVKNNMTSTVQNIGSSVGSIAGTVSNVTSNTFGMVMDIPNLINQTIQSLTTYATSKVSEAIEEMTKDPSGDIATYTAERTSYYMQQLSKDALDVLTKNAEDRAEENEENSEKQQLEDFTNSINNIAENSNKKISEISEMVTKKVNQIAAFSAQGSGWVNSKIDQCKKSAEDLINEYMSKTLEDAKTKRNDFIHSTGERAAKIAYEKASNAAKDALKESMDKVEAAKEKAMTKAKTLIQKAILLVMALVGG